MEIKTDLDAFNYVVKMLLEQNEKSIDQDETCRYRGWSNSIIEQYTKEYEYDGDYDLMTHEPNLKCAVGHLISDVFYTSEIEGNGLDHYVFTLVQLSNPLWFMKGGEELGEDDNDHNSWDLLSDLQKIHDNIPPKEWAEAFNKMSVKFVDGKYNRNADWV